MFAEKGWNFTEYQILPQNLNQDFLFFAKVVKFRHIGHTDCRHSVP